MTQAQTDPEASQPDPSHLTAAGADSAKAGAELLAVVSESSDERVIPLSLEGPGSTLTLQVDGETRCLGVHRGGGVYREWLWLKFWLPNESDEESEPWIQLTGEEVLQLRDHLNEILKPSVAAPERPSDAVSDPSWTGAEGGVS